MHNHVEFRANLMNTFAILNITYWILFRVFKPLAEHTAKINENKINAVPIPIISIHVRIALCFMVIFSQCIFNRQIQQFIL